MESGAGDFRVGQAHERWKGEAAGEEASGQAVSAAGYLIPMVFLQSG